MDRDACEARSISLSKEESFLSTLENRKVKRADHLKKVLNRIKSANNTLSEEGVPVVFYILRLSLNVK